VNSRLTHSEGYILLESAVALVLLSIGTYAVHGTIQQAITARGQAQDYTQARFLLEGLVAEIEQQPEVPELQRKGQFPAPNDRFSWSYSVRRVNLPLPEPTPLANGSTVRYTTRYLGHVNARIEWERRGQPDSESFETLISSQKFWQLDR